MVLNLNLNCPPCEETSDSAESVKGLFESPIVLDETDDEVELLASSAAFPQRRNQPRRDRQMTIDLEQVMEIPTSRSGVSMVEPAAILLALSSDRYHERTSTSRSNLNLPPCFDLEEDDRTKWQWQRMTTRTSSHFEPSKAMITPPLPPPPPPPPKQTILSCPLCMDRLTSPCSTFCGHIFCQGCIEASIAASVKKKAGRQCPTCRAKLPAKKSFHRVYLPIDD